MWNSSGEKRILQGITVCLVSAVLREREREVCVLFEFRHFFNSEDSSTYFKVSCISLLKIVLECCITL